MARKSSLASPPAAPRMTEKELAWRMFGGWGSVFAVVMLGAMAVTVGTIGVLEYQSDAKFRDTGVAVEGKVIDKQVAAPSTSRTNTTTYWLSYRYPGSDGAVYTHRLGVPKSEFDRLTVDGPVRVQYLPDKPSNSRLAPTGTIARSGPTIAGVAAAIFGTFAVAVWVLGRRSARRRAKLVFAGDARPGEVVSVKLRGVGKTRRYIMTYRFTAADGTAREGTTTHVTRTTFEKTKPGDKLPVVVNLEDPTKHEPDVYGVRG